MEDTIKAPPNAAERVALTAAQAAATAAHDAILDATRAGATMHVFNDVVVAAHTAYKAAGGRRRIIVRGHGNSTHPVISVEVMILRNRT